MLKLILVNNMKNTSIWLEYMNNKNFKVLDKNLNIDVLIIGGGITGLSVAYNLINKNFKVALVEKNYIGSGVTAKSTAKITYLQQDIYSKLKTFHSKDISKLYLDSQIEGLNILTDIIKKNKINCNLEKSDSYLFTNKNVNKLKKEKQLLEEFKIKVKNVNKLPDGEKIKYGFKVEDTYVFNPIKYLNTLKRICENNKINIYENTKIEEIKKQNNLYICKTRNNIIKAKYIVLALHYPYFLFPYLMPMKTSLEKSYIKASLEKNNLKFNAINIENPVKSIRYYTDKNNTYKIFLTASHNIAIKNNEQKNFDELKMNNKTKYYWSNIDLITNDYLPFIGLIDDNLLLGTGYNTWGMINASIAGKVLGDIILKKDNKYIELFNPKRDINLTKIINFPMILSSNVYSFINSKVNKFWYNSNIRFEKRNNKKVAIYTDKDNKEHIVYTLCPHLKCSLIFNNVEKTWDCPCHGSRFDIDGKSIEGPSNYDITYKEK